jgi:tetratricopeptide (TPR) repeat protein
MAFLKSVETLTLDGIEQLKKKQYRKALKNFNRASKKRPKDVNILNYLSQSQTALGLIDKALETIDKAIEIEPENVLLWQLKATNLMMVKRYEDAIPVIERCMKLKPGDVNFIMRGQMDYNLERYESAGEWFDKALEFDPENPLSNQMKGLTLYHQKQYAPAIPHLEKALSIGESNAIEKILEDCRSRV